MNFIKNIFKPQGKKQSALSDIENLSRRNFLKKTAATATTIGLAGFGGKNGFDFLAKNPDFKEKVYSEISQYFNEKSMSIRIEKESKDFFNKYGVRLDLKSISEINSIAIEHNETEHERFGVVQKIATNIFNLEINKSIKNGIKIDIETGGKEYENMIKSITDNYIKENPIMPYDVNSYSSTLLNYEKLQLIEKIKKCFSILPVSFVKNLKLETINAGKDPHTANEKYELTPSNVGGFAKTEDKHSKHNSGREIYLDYSYQNQNITKDFSDWASTTIFHELLHIKDFAASNDNLEKIETEWRVFNSKLGGIEYVGDYWNQIDIHSAKGFVHNYGTLNPSEDRATIVEVMFSHPHVLKNIEKRDAILASKVQSLKEEYFKANKVFDDEYWNLLEKGDISGVQKKVKFTV